MNKSHKQLSLVLAAGAAGVAFFSLANAPFTAALPGDVILGLGASLAVYDYSRRVQPLALPVRLLRPTLPAVSRPGDCGQKNSRKDCIAA